MQLEQEEPERGVSDGVRIEKYWKHFMMLKGPDGGPNCPSIFMALIAIVSSCHMGMLMSNEDSPNLVACYVTILNAR